MIIITKNIFIKNQVIRYGISEEGVKHEINLFLIELSSKLDVSTKWRWHYIHFRPKRKLVKAAIVVHASNGQMNLAVKYFVPLDSKGAGVAEAEYRNLVALLRALPASHADILPEPVFATREAYAVEWVSIPKMKRRLVWARFIPGGRSLCLEAAARMLRSVHLARPAGQHRLDLSPYIELAQSSGASEAVWQKNLDHFIAVSNRFRDIVIPYCLIHGDYSPENILFSSDRSVIVDFAEDEKGSIYHDICHCIMYFTFYCKDLSSDYSQRLRLDMKAFSTAYASSDEQIQADIFMLMMWAVLLIRWGRHEAKSKDPHRAYHLRALDWYMARQFQTCCSEMESFFAAPERAGTG